MKLGGGNVGVVTGSCERGWRVDDALRGDSTGVPIKSAVVDGNGRLMFAEWRHPAHALADELARHGAPLVASKTPGSKNNMSAASYLRAESCLRLE